MAKKYRVLQKSFINNAIREEGEEVEYDGEPGPNLAPVQTFKPAKPAKDAKDDKQPAKDAPLA